MDTGQPSEQTLWLPSWTGNSRTSTTSKETDLLENELLPSSFKALLGGEAMSGLVSLMHIFESEEDTTLGFENNAFSEIVNTSPTMFYGFLVGPGFLGILFELLFAHGSLFLALLEVQGLPSLAGADSSIHTHAHLGEQVRLLEMKWTFQQINRKMTIKCQKLRTRIDV
jgi:hypothetical protein